MQQLHWEVNFSPTKTKTMEEEMVEEEAINTRNHKSEWISETDHVLI